MTSIASLVVTAILLWTFGDDSVFGQTTATVRSVEAQGCFLRVRDKAEVPALERGVLKKMLVEPGVSVIVDQPLALLDDVEVRLNLEQAQLDVQIAEKRHRESLAVQIAESGLTEASSLLKQTQLELEITKKIAVADIAIRQAMNESLVSKAELDRAEAARKEFRSSISDQQLAKLRLARDQDLIKLEKANHDQAIDELRSRSKEALVEQQQVAIDRLRHELSEASSARGVAELTIESLRRAVSIAEQRLAKSQLKAPLNGIVVEQLRHTGEWVEAGDPVFRIIRLDLLLVEGYADARQVPQSVRGSKVVVHCEEGDNRVSVEGKVVFVSPEIDPVSQQVQIRAEIPNPTLTLRPGQSARMIIMAQSKTP